MAQFRPQTVIQPDNTDQVSIRIPNTKLPRTRRPVRPDKSCRFNPLAVFSLTLALGLSLALLIAFHRLLPRYNDAAAAVGTSEKKVAAANYSSESKEVKFGHEIYSKGESEGNILPLLYNEGGSRAELDYGENDDDDDAESGDGIDVQDDDHGSGGAEFKAEGRVGMEVGGGRKVDGERRRMGVRKKTSAKRKPKRQRVSGSSCEMKFLDSTAHLVEPVENVKFSKFSLEYTYAEAIPSEASNWIPRFAGYQTPQEREESFYARDQKIKCGFVSGPESSPSTGFDLSEDDRKFMSSCHIAVSSCIFGNSDRLRTPFNKQISRQSRKNVCFVMFIDEITLQTLLSEGQEMDREGKIGLWKIVVVRNLPFTDMRRVGKIPKFLTHRLFPSARYSIWLDSKLRLQTDPYLILEYFLWRKGYEYAISNHYDRHCVWEEVAQNKKLNKYNHSVIDQQFEFYQSDGLTRFDPSDPNKPLPSYVPEGSFIIRAHTPMSNLFSCLWFNEVDHFTPRDQLSFAYTYLKLTRKNPGKTFHLNMFKDCERRMIAKLFHHRAEEKRTPALTVR